MFRQSMWASAVCLSVAVPAFAQADKQTAKPMAGAGGVSATLMHHEQSMIESLQKGDFAGFAKWIAPGSWSVDADGFMTIEDFVTAAKDPKNTFKWDSFKTSGMKVVDVNPTAKIVAYTLEQKGSFMGRPFASPVYASTVWVNHGGAWHAVFHQESTASKP
jgi:hypothetical protein